MVHFGVAVCGRMCAMGDMAATAGRGVRGGRTMDITGDPFLTENPSVTYRDAHLYCDRDGVLGVGSHVPDGMLPIIRAPWLRLSLAATGLALQSSDGAKWIVPGVPEAGEDADAAMDAIWAFRERLLAALLRPIHTRRNAP